MNRFLWFQAMLTGFFMLLSFAMAFAGVWLIYEQLAISSTTDVSGTIEYGDFKIGSGAAGVLVIGLAYLFFQASNKKMQSLNQHIIRANNDELMRSILDKAARKNLAEGILETLSKRAKS